MSFVHDKGFFEPGNFSWKTCTHLIQPRRARFKLTRQYEKLMLPSSTNSRFHIWLQRQARAILEGTWVMNTIFQACKERITLLPAAHALMLSTRSLQGSINPESGPHCLDLRLQLGKGLFAPMRSLQILRLVSPLTGKVSTRFGEVSPRTEGCSMKPSFPKKLSSEMALNWLCEGLKSIGMLWR